MGLSSRFQCLEVGRVSGSLGSNGGDAELIAVLVAPYSCRLIEVISVDNPDLKLPFWPALKAADFSHVNSKSVHLMEMVSTASTTVSVAHQKVIFLLAESIV